MRSTRICFFVFFIFFVSIDTFSQGRKLYPGQTKTRAGISMPVSRKLAYRFTYFVGLGRGTYYGQLYDLREDGAFKFPGLNPQLNLGMRYRINNRFSVGGSYRFLRLSSSDRVNDVSGESGRRARNLSFTTIGHEISVFGRFDILPSITRFIGSSADQYNRRNPIVPYVMAGAGILIFNPYGKYEGKRYNLRKIPNTQEKLEKGPYSPITAVLYGGPGVQVKLTEFLDLTGELIITRTFTDNLDDVKAGSKYPSNNLDPIFAESPQGKLTDPSEIRRDPNGTYPYRGGTRTNAVDYYFMINIGLNYTVSTPLKLKQPRHKHFGKGKGSKKHKFESR